MGFFDTLRRPKALTAWADDGRIRAGESDYGERAFDILKRRERDENNARAANAPIMMDRMGGGGIGRIARGEENTRPMNVVYDQRPEMMDKQLRFEKDQAALQQKNLEAARATGALKDNDEYIDNRRKFEFAQRQADTTNDLNRQRIAMTLGDREKLQIENANRLAQIGAQNANAMSLASLNHNNQKSMNDADNAARIRAAEIAANKPTAANTTTPGEKSQDTMNRLQQFLAENPEYAPLVSIAPNGRSFSLQTEGIKDDAMFGGESGETDLGRSLGIQASGNAPKIGLEDARRRLAKYIYGDNNVTNVGGLGSAALGASLGSAGVSGNIAERGSPTAAYQKGTPTPVKRKVRNKRTGEVIEQTSMDGGQTWR